MRYVALLRGIGPGNPAMRNDKLRGVLEGLGFDAVESVISSGNLVFEAGRRRGRALEDLIEKAWPEQLGFRSTTIVRSPRQVRDTIEGAPFHGHDDTPEARLQVTFLKRSPGPEVDDASLAGEGWSILGRTDDAVYWSVDTTRSTTPDVMRLLERTIGPDITTRTWKTVHRIAARLG